MLEQQLGAGGDFAARLRRRARGRAPRAEPARYLGPRARDAASASTRSKRTSFPCGSSCRPTASRASGRNDANQARTSSSPATSRKALGAASAIGDDTLQRNAGQAVVPDSFTHGTLRTAHPLVHDRVPDGLPRGLRHLQGGRPLIARTHPVPPEFAARAVVKAADYQAFYQASIRDPEGFWARVAKRIDWYRFPTRIKDVSFDPDDFRIRWYEDGELNVSVNCLDRQLAKRGDKTALLFEGDDPSLARHVSYRELYESGLPLRQCAARARRQERRSRHHLHADDPGSRDRDARLRAHRRGAFGRLRRLLARIARRPHRGLRLEARHHRRRRRARRQADTAQGERGRGDRVARAFGPPRGGRAPHRPRGRLVRGARRPLRGARRRGTRNLRAGADGRGRPALHPVHLGLDRKAQGRAAHDRRLPGVRELHVRDASSTTARTTSTGARPTSAG